MNQKKYICVVGLGHFGAELATNLAQSCEILAMDSSEKRVNALVERVQRAVIMDARDFAALSSVVTPDFDEAIVTISGNLEASILCTLHLKKIGVPMIRAKAISDDHAAILSSVGAQEVIFPERESARRLAVKIINPNLLDFVSLAEGYEVQELAPPDSFNGHSIKELELRKQFGVFVIAIKELVPERFVFLPDPSFVIKPSDILVMIGRQEDLQRIQEGDL
ncbi:MAG: TrkA family potassium uptake protein [Deltaproteobacteria bacterium]|nr:TrkA family potassium uptake protein [Deltaproteobacteria bacterium]MBW1952642.1 TrkA family potassium uptake protein [Deltaproteobacteria bacterium]MBW1986230.1 TrkA family potassium uptake protein [Deltaproteobacteria bacterium]MBW2134127.1 TrkA family potassium uptake protein [Deltaproteobacteria bacterium]